MPSGVSSAEPDQLYRYAQLGAQLDQELAARARSLASTLAHFEATCTEYPVHVSYLAPQIIGHSSQADSIGDWVHGVGAAFEQADSSSLVGWTVTQLQAGGGWSVGAALGGLLGSVGGLSLTEGPLAGPAQAILELISPAERIWPPWVRLPVPAPLGGLVGWLEPKVEWIDDGLMGPNREGPGPQAYVQPYPSLRLPRLIELPFPSWPPFGISLPPLAWPPIAQIGIPEPWAWLLPIGLVGGAVGGVALLDLFDLVDDAVGRIDDVQAPGAAGETPTGITTELPGPVQAPAPPNPSAQTTGKVPGSPLGVSFVSQWNGKSGGGNCGPASLAMIIQFYGGQIKFPEAVSDVRGGSAGSGDTDFKSSNSKDLLGEYGLVEQDVNGLAALKGQLDQGHPVIMAVNNSYLIRKEGDQYVPYPPSFQAAHIIVVTGYAEDANGNIDAVYINDPLAVKTNDGGKTYQQDPDGGTDFKVPIDSFNEAAGSEGWYGSAISQPPTEMELA
jgi:hypothetical protein